MPQSIANTLFDQGLLGSESMEKLQKEEGSKRVSLYHEIHWLLYLGILLSSSGLGVMLYSRRDQFGHFAIITLLLISCMACYWYAFQARKRKTISSKASQLLPDYILLLGCLLLVSVIGYLQAEFQVFGNRWALASFVPMVLLFISAYYFDHKGVLALAIINLFTFAGITINQSTWYGIGQLNQSVTIYTTLAISAAFIFLARWVKESKLRPQFSETYHQFGFHGLYLAGIAGIIYLEKYWLLWLILTSVIGIYFLYTAYRQQSGNPMIFSFLYLYFAWSYVISSRFFTRFRNGDQELYFNFLYYLVTGTALAFLLIKLYKKFTRDDRIQ